MTVQRAASIAALGLAAALLAAPAEVGAREGQASWYALTSKTASGERMNPNAMTAAHRSLPFGTRVRVQNLRNGRTVVVRINDRGPFTRGRVIDVSRAAAAQLGFVSAGTAPVRITPLGGGASVHAARSSRSSRAATASATGVGGWVGRILGLGTGR